MKIVKFKDGRYGVRKWDWSGMCYLFYYTNNHNIRLTSDGILPGFWALLTVKHQYAIKHKTYSSALNVYEALTAKNIDEKSVKDTGTPVKEQL